MGAKRKSGLHKEISSIFGGVPLTGQNGRAEGTADSAAANKMDAHLPPRPAQSPPAPQVHQKETPKDLTQAATAEQTIGPGKLQGKACELWQNVKAKLLTPPEGVSPSRHYATLVMIPVLLLVVMLVFGRLLLQSGSKASGSTESEKSVADAKAKTQIEWQKPAPYPEDLRDPMTKYSPATTNSVVTGDIVVRGIVWSEDRPAAVIGSQIVYEGQSVQGAKVIDITREGVQFQRNGNTWMQKIAN